MPVNVYVFIQAEPRQVKKIVEAVSKIVGVKTVHPVTGLYDVVAFAEVYDLKTLSTFLMTKIGGLQGVQRTHTAVVLERT